MVLRQTRDRRHPGVGADLGQCVVAYQQGGARWIRAHNCSVKQTGCGVRILPCYLPTKSPWLNPIEPKWIHGKRAVLEPERVLTTDELEARVYAYYRCTPDSHLVIPDKDP